MIYVNRKGKDPIIANSWQELFLTEIEKAGTPGLTIGMLYGHLTEQGVDISLDVFLPVIDELKSDGALVNQDGSPWTGGGRMRHRDAVTVKHYAN